MKIDKRTKFYKWICNNYNKCKNDIFLKKGKPSEMINMFTIEELKIEYLECKI